MRSLQLHFLFACLVVVCQTSTSIVRISRSSALREWNLSSCVVQLIILQWNIRTSVNRAVPHDFTEQKTCNILSFNKIGQKNLKSLALFFIVLTYSEKASVILRFYKGIPHLDIFKSARGVIDLKAKLTGNQLLT